MIEVLLFGEIPAYWRCQVPQCGAGGGRVAREMEEHVLATAHRCLVQLDDDWFMVMRGTARHGDHVLLVDGLTPRGAERET